MAAPVVVSARVTVCAVVKVPPLGEIVGAFGGGILMVKVAVVTLLLAPLRMAIAFTVVVADSWNGAVYWVEEAVGVLPFTV